VYLVYCGGVRLLSASADLKLTHASEFPKKRTAQKKYFGCCCGNGDIGAVSRKLFIDTETAVVLMQS
jgi:hypothetical protein